MLVVVVVVVFLTTAYEELQCKTRFPRTLKNSTKGQIHLCSISVFRVSLRNEMSCSWMNRNQH